MYQVFKALGPNVTVLGARSSGVGVAGLALGGGEFDLKNSV